MPHEDKKNRSEKQRGNRGGGARPPDVSAAVGGAVSAVLKHFQALPSGLDSNMTAPSVAVKSPGACVLFRGIVYTRSHMRQDREWLITAGPGYLSNLCLDAIRYTDEARYGRGGIKNLYERRRGEASPFLDGYDVDHSDIENDYGRVTVGRDDYYKKKEYMLLNRGVAT